MASLRSLIIKIGADTANVEKALASVGESAKTLDAGLKKLGNTPIGKQAQSDLEKLKESVQKLADQNQKLAQQSVLAARGLEAVGGPARLTKSQLDAVARSVNSGLDAFRALGQEAPIELRKVSAAIAEQQRALESLGRARSGGGGFGGDVLSGLGLTTGAGIGLAIGGTISALAKQALDAADALSKLSDRTGVSIVGLQRLQAIAEPSGNTIEDLAGAINRFQKNIAEGDATAGQALTRIGLSFEKLQELSPDQQFIEIAKAIQSIQDPAEQTLVAMQLFGKGGAEILPSLKAKVDELADSTFKMSQTAVQALDGAGDAFQTFKRNATSAIGEVLGDVLALQAKLRELATAPFPSFARPGALEVGKKGFRAIGGFVSDLFGPGATPAAPSPADQGPNLIFPNPKVPENLTGIIKGLTAELNDNQRAAFLASDAYRQMQRALEEFAKIGTESTTLTRDFSAALDQLPSEVIDLNNAFVGAGPLVTRTLQEFSEQAKEVEEAFKKAFGVAAGASLGLPGVSPGNTKLIADARGDIDAATLATQNWGVALDLVVDDLGLVGQSADEGTARFIRGIRQILIVVRELIVELNAAAVAATFLDILKGVGVGLGIALAFVNQGGIVTGSGIRGFAKGGRVPDDGVQYFGGGGRVLPFLTRGTDTVPAMLTPGEWVLNREQQRELGAALGGTQVHNHYDLRNTIITDMAGLARQIGPHHIQNLAENKDGMYSRARAALGLRS